MSDNEKSDSSVDENVDFVTQELIKDGDGSYLDDEIENDPIINPGLVNELATDDVADDTTDVATDDFRSQRFSVFDRAADDFADDVADDELTTDDLSGRTAYSIPIKFVFSV